MTPESSASASRSSGLAMPVRGRIPAPPRRPVRSAQREPADLVGELLDRISLTGWTVRQRAGRTLVAPAMPVNRLQGWKLHVSATPANAAEVLAACVPVLVETGTPFGFVATAAGLAELNGPRAPRARAGKFLTVHPADDELFRELAKRLDEATLGHVGPAVLSDRPYRSGGVVHYRYGAFGGVGVLDNDGRYRRCLVDPEGNLVEDRCEPAFRPPAWAELPFDSSPERPAPGLLGSLGWPTGPAGPSRSVASMQVLGTSTAGPVIGSTGTAGSAGGGPGGPAGPEMPARSGGSTGAEGPAGSGGPASAGKVARSGGPARPGVPAGAGDPVRPAGAAGSTGAVGSAGTWGPADPTGPAEVLIGGRYAVTGALRQANKGGVYRARDLRTGIDVLIKEARPYVGADASGRDVRDLLGHEARVLRHLLPLGVTPRPLREFVQGDHRFLVVELLPGRPLCADQPDPSVQPAAGPDPPGWPQLLGRLAQLVGAVHSVGVVLRDLAPENVLLLPGGELRLVDLELAALRTGGPADWSYLDLRHYGVPGFVAPEQWRGATPDPSADLFSLGVVALWLTGRIPPTGISSSLFGQPGVPSVGQPGVPSGAGGLLPVRPPEEWVAALLDPSFGGPPVPVPLRRIVTGLLRTEPADRIGLAEVVALCAGAGVAGPPGEPAGRPAQSAGSPANAAGCPAEAAGRPAESAGWPTGSPGRPAEDAGREQVDAATLPEPAWEALVEQALRRLDPTPEPGSTVDSGIGPGTHPAPAVRRVGWSTWGPGQLDGGPGSDRWLGSDPGYAGLARSVAALTRLVVQRRELGEPARPVGAAQALELSLDRLLYSLDRAAHPLPGLRAGAAAAVWALCDAGRLLARPYLLDRAVELALRLPVYWPDPGLGYGLAGLGTGLLHLWRHTYLPALRDRLTALAGHLLDTVDPGGTMVWTVDPSFDSVRAGLRSYGLDHGTAGIGAFLLATGHLLARRDLTAAAVRCAQTLLDAAEPVGDCVRWPAPPAEAGVARPRWVDDDPAGIGSFLTRVYLHTGDSRCRDAAMAAARTVVASRWSGRRGGALAAYPTGAGGFGSGPGPGPAADGEFLLDLAGATGELRYAAWAEALAARWWTTEAGRQAGGEPQRLDRPDRPEPPVGDEPDPAGELAFLLRLRLGGPRLFYPDPAGGPTYRGTGHVVVDPTRPVGLGAGRS